MKYFRLTIIAVLIILISMSVVLLLVEADTSESSSNSNERFLHSDTESEFTLTTGQTYIGPIRFNLSSVEYSVSPNIFSISNTGELSFKIAPDSTKDLSQYNPVVTATDGVNTVSHSITVKIDPSVSFITKWDLWRIENELILFDLSDYPNDVNFVIDWGDNSAQEVVTKNTGQMIKHTYTNSVGQVTMKITGLKNNATEGFQKIKFSTT